MDPARPRHGSLRRAVSTAYYAVFHLLIQTAVDSLVGFGPSPVRKQVGSAATRWFTHTTMAKTCGLFTGPVVRGKLEKAVPRAPVSAAVPQAAGPHAVAPPAPPAAGAPAAVVGHAPAPAPAPAPGPPPVIAAAQVAAIAAPVPPAAGPPLPAAAKHLPVSAELQAVARAFKDLQEARHDADYDMTRRFTRQEALVLIERAEQAFLDWTAAEIDPVRTIFMLMLLGGEDLIRTRE